MARRNPSEPYDEGALGAATAPLQIPDTTEGVRASEATSWSSSAAAETVVPHRHAADRGLAPGYQGRPADVARTVGDKLGNALRYIRGQNFERVGNDLLTYARRYPAQSLAGGVAAGFLVGRLLRRR